MVRQLLFIYTFLVVFIARSQDINFDFADFVFNPAYVVDQESFVSASVYDRQSKIAGSDRTYGLLGQYNFMNYNSAIGLSVFNNNFASLKSTSFKLNYKYKVKFDSVSYLSLGLGVGAEQLRLSNQYVFEDQLSLLDTRVVETTESISTNSNTSFVTDLGVMYTHRQFTIGGALIGLLSPSWRFVERDIVRPTQFNSSISYEMNLNSSKTLKLKPVVFSVLSSRKTRLGLNTKIDFSGYEGFEGDVYLGIEFVDDISQRSLTTWSVYTGYSQNNIAFQYGIGNGLVYGKQLGFNNRIIISYYF